MSSNLSNNVLIKKLNALGSLSDEEERAFIKIIGPRRTVNAGADIVEDGSSPAFSTVLLEGFCCRYKLLRQGRRQILAFQIPGDLLDIYSYVLPKMDHAIGALTRCTVAPIAHTEIRRITERFPNLGHLLWRDSLSPSPSVIITDWPIVETSLWTRSFFSVRFTCTAERPSASAIPPCVTGSWNLFSVTSPTAFNRWCSSQKRCAMRLTAERRPTPVSHVRTMEASTRES